jgi:hypothetical protein
VVEWNTSPLLIYKYTHARTNAALEIVVTNYVALQRCVKAFREARSIWRVAEVDIVTVPLIGSLLPTFRDKTQVCPSVGKKCKYRGVIRDYMVRNSRSVQNSIQLLAIKNFFHQVYIKIVNTNIFSNKYTSMYHT